ncbi:sigma-70 family RNA polymerase sigma factor [Candidatus Peregrinibacteria bacterium]|nr:sigma-70 family RNA polymerase sigma factor [Candidatus Peregrinibacteria bacterium]
MSKKDPAKELGPLVILAKQGDTEAFGKIYDILVKPVYRYIYYRVDKHIAEDLTEETFLKVWQNLTKYKAGKHPFSAWVFKIAHNLICDHYRKNEASFEMDENIADTKLDASPSHQINIKLNEVRLKRAIKQLPENYQQIIVLKYINEEENAVIAKVIGKSEGAVRTLQFRALEKLRGLLEEKREDF